MTLCNWIEKTGPKKVAQLLKVDPSTVSYWRTNGSCPPPKRMVQIFKLSKGKVTYQSMVETYVKAKKK